MHSPSLLVFCCYALDKYSRRFWLTRQSPNQMIPLLSNRTQSQAKTLLMVGTELPFYRFRCIGTLKHHKWAATSMLTFGGKKTAEHFLLLENPRLSVPYDEYANSCGDRISEMKYFASWIFGWNRKSVGLFAAAAGKDFGDWEGFPAGDT